MINRQRCLGTSPSRPDGLAKAVGSAVFTDDIVLDGMLHGATVRCPHPHARILRIDASAALEVSGVTVVTASDLPGPNALQLIEDDWPILGSDVVHHAEEAVALVAAPTREQARKAAALVEVEYEELPAVTSLEEACAAESSGAGSVRILASCNVNAGDVDQGFAEADLIFEDVYRTGHQEHAYIEPHAMIAIPHPGGVIEIAGSLQCPYYVKHALEPLFSRVGLKVRVRQVTTGGGFGGKEDYPDMIGAHAAVLAWKCGHPVKLVYDRQEDIVATTKRHPARLRHRTGIRKDGTLVAMDIEVILDGGAYVTLSPVVLSRGLLHAGGPYRCPNVRISGRVLSTNTAPNGAFRGFGAPQTQFAVERHMDLLAREAGLDPFTMRQRNAYVLGDQTPTGQVLDRSVSAQEVLALAVERSGFLSDHREAESHRSGRDPDDPAPLRGFGLSLSWHGSGFTGNGERQLQARAAVELQPDGRIHVLAASTDFGQGTSIVLAQIVSDAMGLPLDQIHVPEPDTDLVPDSGPTVASRTVMIVGSVLARAGSALALRLRTFIAAKTGARPDEVALSNLPGVAGAFIAAGEASREEAMYDPGDAAPFDEENYRGTAYPAYGWGCHVVEVEVDPDTLVVQPKMATLVFDVGRAVHPVLCEGQIEGGSLQGLAFAYLEEMKLERGRYLNDRFSTYIIPSIMDSPVLDTILVENPAPTGPDGAKGIGELPVDGAAPALLAAIENATGIRATSIPATPERLLAHLQRGDGGAT